MSKKVVPIKKPVAAPVKKPVAAAPVKKSVATKEVEKPVVKEKKVREQRDTASGLVIKMLLARKSTDAEIIAAVGENFPESKVNNNQVAFYRGMLNTGKRGYDKHGITEETKLHSLVRDPSTNKLSAASRGPRKTAEEKPTKAVEKKTVASKAPAAAPVPVKKFVRKIAAPAPAYEAPE